MDKKEYGMFKGMALCSKYDKMGKEERDAVRSERLRDLVLYAKENSPYYSKLYGGIGEEFKLEELAPVNKLELMEHWDEWLTDRSVSLADINKFMSDPDNIGRKLKDKFLVFTTSGSTGNPLVAVCDDTTNNIMGAVNAKRTFARKDILKKFFLRGAKTIGVFATGGFYLGNSSVRARLLTMPWKKRQMAVTSALLPTDEIVRQLNEFQPAMLGGYPSSLELLIDEQRSGSLHISPVLIMTGGEYLSEKLRAQLTDAFDCFVQTSYSCTEGGTIACECTEGHFHINDDWVIVEPVDKDNKPVPNGVLSDKILLTNLFNFTQPYIRYEVTDRVVMHDEPCACGKESPWLVLEGRTDDVVSFECLVGEKKMAPLPIYATLKEVHELKRFQLLVYPNNRAELRLEPTQGCSREKAFDKAAQALRAYLSMHDIEKLELTLSDELPKQHPKSGKFKSIISEQ